MSQTKQYSFFIVRYVPDLVREEFVNIGVLVQDLSNAQMPMIVFTRDWTRLLSLDKEADIKMLRALEEDLRSQLVEKHQEGALSFVDVMRESFSNNVQMTDEKGRSAESMKDLAEELMSLYVLPSTGKTLFALASGS